MTLAQVRGFVTARLDRKSELGLRLTINLVVVVAALWAFGGLLSEVLEKEGLVRWDAAVEKWFHFHATPLGMSIFSSITLLGSPVAIATDALVAAAIGWRRDWMLLWIWTGTIVGGWLVEAAFKLSVHRARPEYALRYIHGGSYSFPSGHTMSSTVTYGMLAHLLVHFGRVRGAARTAIYLGAAVVIGAVALSRLYLGVHFPSDVAGGFLIGLGWVVASAIVYQVVRAVRPPVAGTT